MNVLNCVELSTGWEWVRLGDLGNWYGGGTPSKNHQKFWTNGSIPWLSPKDMGPEVIQSTRDHITVSGVAASAVRLVPSHSVAIVVRSGILERTIPVALVPFETTLNQDMKAVSAHKEVSPRWIAWALRASMQRILDECRKAGTTVASLSTDALMDFRIPLAPVSEQRRIVEALEGYLSRLEAATDDLAAAQERARFLRMSAVERAMNGGLAVSSDEDEPVSILLKKLEYDLSRGSDRRRKGTASFAPLSLSAKLPAHWAVRPLGSLAVKIEYGTSTKAHTNPDDAAVPVLRMGNIQNGRLDLSSLKYLPADHPDVEKLSLRDGDLLFNRTNSAELVGKAAVYHSIIGPAIFASYLIRVQLPIGIEPEWVSLFINSPEGRRYINSVAAQQVGQANVNGSKLGAFPIPVPPHGEQLRLLVEVREWHETVERTANITQRALKRSLHLRRSLLHHAFSGMLVPHDPADEPVSALLDRIRAEHANQPSKPKGRGRRPRKTNATNDKSPPPPPPVSSPAPTTAVQQELPF